MTQATPGRKPGPAQQHEESVLEVRGHIQCAGAAVQRVDGDVHAAMADAVSLHMRAAVAALSDAGRYVGVALRELHEADQDAAALLRTERGAA